MDIGAASITQGPSLPIMTPDGSMFTRRKMSRARDVPSPEGGLGTTAHQRAVITSAAGKQHMRCRSSDNSGPVFETFTRSREQVNKVTD